MAVSGREEELVDVVGSGEEENKGEELAAT